MITKTVRWQLIALAIVTIVGVGYAGFRYAGLDRIFGATTYPVTVQMADSGGIFTGADVTYRGVSVGRVGPLSLSQSGVDVQLDIANGSPEIPADTRAVVGNLSPIGEQYVDLRPVADGGETLAAGAVIPQERTQAPVGINTFLTELDGLVSTVPKDSLRTVVSELGQGFEGTAQPLQQLLDTSGQFTRTATEALPQTTALIRDARPVLTTQNEVAPQFQEFSRGLREVAEQLKQSDPDIRRIIDDGPRAGDQLSGLIRESGPGLGESVANLRTVSELLEPRQAGLRQLLVTYPGLVAVAPNVVPGDGTAHLGLVVNFFDPPACARGYEGTDTRGGLDVSEVPVNSDARCAEPPGSPTNVRGMQNVERPQPLEVQDYSGNSGFSGNGGDPGAGGTDGGPGTRPNAGSLGDDRPERIASSGLVDDAAQILMGG
ncbi:MCE-family protein Mce1F [Pseudonocardia sp. Ae168_Ps1]|uniref:MCE family protein n=1 Tax=unclassified Pseudonocardia TaxID=2619320 RepID=UPI00094B60F2|nr:MULTISPECIES: MCE family protein [unclassified Pseudonocardia]OLL74163.1 MCE-family protein Mce1F [Pseudonocardia sp. Ae150A_Ps1]OLL80145.1 MCE-family protein Mce1F [Pseudonocardia sp. Ae168_Ps1]OLL85727.1 MCE-family protein Mce1F [Pseudonocardia sp. Ae263_Ps1]OLL94243.1 MCE-family protein Mce1F [Pseudonocardia sp. Ae356_Ps1]